MFENQMKREKGKKICNKFSNIKSTIYFKIDFHAAPNLIRMMMMLVFD